MPSTASHQAAYWTHTGPTGGAMIGFRSNRELIDSVVHRGLVTNDRAIKAMRETDRANYSKCDPYRDSPQSINYGVTISAPHMHAVALQELSPALKPGSVALDVGSGSGYLAVCMAKMVGVDEGKGKVVGIDVIRPLVNESLENVKRDSPKLYGRPNFQLIYGDGWKGLPNEGPFDAIHVGAAAETLPQELVNQLAPNGLMFIPLGPQMFGQLIHRIKKLPDGSIEDKKLFPVSYVPLVKETSEVHRHSFKANEVSDDSNA